VARILRRARLYYSRSYYKDTARSEERNDVAESKPGRTRGGLDNGTRRRVKAKAHRHGMDGSIQGAEM